MADQLGRSVGDMYEGAIIPGLVLTGLYAGYVLAVTILFPKAAPALPAEALTIREDNGSHGVTSFCVLLALTAIVAYAANIWLTGRVEQGEAIFAVGIAVGFAYVVALINHYLHLGLLSRLAAQVVFVLVPPLALIFLVLGTIFVGIATPTEGGAMGASGALVLALAKKRLSLDLMKQAMDSTAKLSAFVIFILVGARVFSLTFYGVDGHKWVEELLVGLPGGETGFLIFVNVLVFFLAFFLDFFELAFIIVPLLGPAAERLGIDLIWFGVILGVNMQTSFMHPPFGFSLFYLRSVAPRVPYLDKITGRRMEPVTTGQIYWGAVPFVGIQVIMIGLVILFPQMVMHYKGAGTGIDPNSIQNFDIPGLDMAPPPGLEGLGGPPSDLAPPADLAPPSDLAPPPGLAPPADPATPPGLSPPQQGQ